MVSVAGVPKGATGPGGPSAQPMPSHIEGGPAKLFSSELAGEIT